MGTNNLQEVWAKAVADLEEVVLLAKSHVSSYTRSDGTFVAEHDDKRVSKKAAPKQEKTKFNLPEVPELGDKKAYSLKIRRAMKAIRERVEMSGADYVDNFKPDGNGMINLIGGGESVSINASGSTGQIVSKFLGELKQAGPKEGSKMFDGVRHHILQGGRWRPL